MNTKKIVLHIGPPKTGTTSLQYALEKVDHANFFYGGIYQPRGCIPYYDLAKQLYFFSISEKKEQVDLLRGAIEKLVEKFDLVFLSEEMFLLHSEKIEVGEKISKVVNLLEGIDVTLLYTYRLPQHAIPSLFQELYPKLPLMYVNDFEKFSMSKYAEVYSVESVRKIANRLNVEFRVFNVFDFCKDGNCSLGAVVGDERFKDTILSVPFENKGKKMGNLRELSRDSFVSCRISRVSRRLKKSRLGNYVLMKKICESLDELSDCFKTRAYLDEESLMIKKL